MPRLEGKVALISGAAQGMGASHARAIVRHGGSVVIGDVDDERGKVFADSLGPRARFVHLDVRNSADWDDAVAMAVREFGCLNVLVNNAGVLRHSGVEQCSDEEWDLVLGINLTGAFKGIRAAADELKNSSPSSVINISSTAGLKGFAGFTAYGSSKWGLRPHKKRRYRAGAARRARELNTPGQHQDPNDRWPVHGLQPCTAGPGRGS